MIISHTRKFIFTAIPKTGTHAVRFALRPYLKENDWEQVGLFKNSKLPIDNLAKKTHGHITLKELHPYLKEEQWQSYLKFATIRNPWDRFISYYFFKQNKKLNTLVKNPLPVMKLMIAHDKQFKRDILSLPQSNFLLDDNGELAVDMLMHQESLQSDFDKIMQRLGLPLTQLEVVNSSTHNNYRSYYDDELKEMVAEYYKQDIALFNYKF